MRYTHIARVLGVRCYFNIHTNEAKGVTLLHDMILEFLLSIAQFIDSEGFKVELIKKLDNE